MTENEARRIINSALLIKRNNPGSAFYMDAELYYAIDIIMKRPTLPKELTDEMLLSMHNGYGNTYAKYLQDADKHRTAAYRREYTSLYNYLTTPPKPNTRKVWCLAFVYTVAAIEKDAIIYRDTEYEISKERDACLRMPKDYKNVSPIWEQEVPA